MCGIAGVVAAGASALVDRRDLDAAVRMLEHRGPDASAVWMGDRLGLAHTRLAIIDRAHGAQPMFSEDGRYVVVFNGEIYNHRALRRELEGQGHRFRTRCDTEVLLALYERLGVGMVDVLRGMFAFAVFDLRERRGLLARDRFGEKPLYVARLPDGLAFASTLDALCVLLPEEPEIDHRAIAEYLVLQYIPDPLTPFVGVDKLAPGHRAVWQAGALETSRYWSPPPHEGGARNKRKSIVQLRNVVGNAVRARLESEVPLGVFLSGGLDSSTIVAEMVAAGVRPRTYSVGFRSAPLDESPYARKVAEAFNTDHHELVADDDVGRLFEDFVRAYDEPFADSSALATLAVARAASEHLTVVLTGDGGDEMFWGYDRYRAVRLAFQIRTVLGPLSELIGKMGSSALTLLGAGRTSAGAAFVANPWPAYRDRLIHFSPGQARALLARDLAEEMDPGGALRRLDRLWLERPGLVSTLPWVDAQTYLPSDLLVKMDRATMAFGLEARAPFLDHGVADLCASFPTAWMFDRRGGKSMLRSAYENVLPTEIVRRPKAGFGVPLDSWLRGPLRSTIEELLIAPSGPLEGILDGSAIAALAHRFLAGDERLRWQTWNLVALAGWASTRIGAARRAARAGS